MNSFTLHDLQPLLDAHASPLLLFQDECLCGLNQAASRLFSSLSPGLSAQSLLGEDAYSAFSYAGSGSRIFSGEILGLRRGAACYPLDGLSAVGAGASRRIRSKRAGLRRAGNPCPPYRGNGPLRRSCSGTRRILRTPSFKPFLPNSVRVFIPYIAPPITCGFAVRRDS